MRSIRWHQSAWLVSVLLLAVTAAPAGAVWRRAFATSVAGTGNLSSWPDAGGQTGLAAGDAICRARATAAALPNAATYRAWLSTSATDAYCHVQGLSGTRANACDGASQPGGGPWMQANGITPFTDTLARLTGNERVIYRNLIFNELGQQIPFGQDRVWTGTYPNGSGVAETCANWTSTAGTGGTGSTFTTAYHWTTAGPDACGSSRSLICLEPGSSDPVALFWLPSSLVFVTGWNTGGNLGSWPGANGAQGIAAGDAVCQAEAAAAHLPAPESFVAWLSSAAVDAVDRLATNGPFARVDGYFVANSREDLVDGTTQLSLHVTANRGYLAEPGAAWTGTAADGTWNGNDCIGWTSATPGDGGRAGLPQWSRRPTWTDHATWTCPSFGMRLYCFSNVITIFWDGFDYTGDTSRWSSSVP